MKTKHLVIRIEQCLALAKASNCPRRKFGDLLLDPVRNVILMDGYNGGPRGGGELCGGENCLRDVHEVPRGTRIEIGCHHAEMNVICNAAAGGVATQGAWLVVTGEPMHHVRQTHPSRRNRTRHRGGWRLRSRQRCDLFGRPRRGYRKDGGTPGPTDAGLTDLEDAIDLHGDVEG